MYKLIDKIPENIPEDKIDVSSAMYRFFAPYWMEIKKYSKNDIFNLAIKDFSYDKDISKIKEIIFNETSLEKFCSHFAGLTYIGFEHAIVIDFPFVIFSSYIKNNKIFLCDENEEKYIKVLLGLG